MTSIIDLTLCVCTMNRPDDLRRCLASVFGGTTRPAEVIVSDDAADGRAASDVAKEFPGARYQRGPRRGLGPNRNACVAAASRPHLMFVDDDVEVPADLFARAAVVLGSTSPGTIVTGYEMKFEEGRPSRVEPHNADFWGIQHVSPRGNYRSIVINATFFPRDVFSRTLFDERLRYGSEEVDIARHAVALGYVIRFEPALYVNHHPSPINREGYRRFVDASRFYATAKAYWSYERSPLKAAAYCVLAPPKEMLSQLRRRGPRAAVAVAASAALACRYAWAASWARGAAA